MNLFCHPISPYARKAMILARYHRLEIAETRPEKEGAKGYIAGDNPLGKIPALEWKPDQYLFDSPVICEYLDSLGNAPLLPKSGDARYLNLWQHALGDGLSDAVYNYRQETVRPKSLHWDEAINRHETAIVQSIETLERICKWIDGPWTYGNLAIVCALDYASYRAGHLNWQDRAPGLENWKSNFENDPHYTATFGYETA
ncbi:glutathione S-transferase N-terminal domain-containing protein [Litorimonas haliclonae]|uniref:glutathione S-transferase N-terminal domain-containing protein n=1 Tax=Litorimonas haliclonae TaxID=2081977 RepID=UPI0039EF37FD